MKFQLEGTPEEMRTKGEALVKAMAAQLAPHNPELADTLRKAMEHDHSKLELRHQPLKDRHDHAVARYRRAMAAAQEEINALLEADLKKSQAADAEPYENQVLRLADRRGSK